MTSAAARLLPPDSSDTPFGRAARLGLRPAAPVSEHRRRRRECRTRRTASELRADMRQRIVDHIRLLADPENDWRRDSLEFGRARAVMRYRLALNSLRGEPKPELPAARDYARHMMEEACHGEH